MRMMLLPLLLVPLTADEVPTPKVPLGKATTVVSEPLTKLGYIDYETALNQRMSQGIKPEDNANVLIWQALGPTPEGGVPPKARFFKWLGIEQPPAEGEYLLHERKFLDSQGIEDRETLLELIEQLQAASYKPWQTRDYPRVAALLKANEKPLALFHQASLRPQYYNPLVANRENYEPGCLISCLLPAVQKCRQTAQYLTVRAMLHAGEGRLDDAWQDLQTCHRLGRLLARGGTLIEFLVGVAIDTIASEAEIRLLDRPEVSAKQVRAWLADLQALPAIPSMPDKVALTERFVYLDLMQHLRRDGYPVLARLATDRAVDGDDNAEEAMAVIDWETALREGNRWYDRLEANLRLPERADRVAANAKFRQDLALVKPRIPLRIHLWLAFFGNKEVPDKVLGRVLSEVMLSMLVPAIEKVSDAADRFEQTQRNQQVAFALVLHQREKGRYAETLDALAPGYLKTVPKDVMSGGSLIYKPHARGFLLYSVGVNGKDDAGRGYADEPRADDLRVRLPVPPRRPNR